MLRRLGSSRSSRHLPLITVTFLEDTAVKHTMAAAYEDTATIKHKTKQATSQDHLGSGAQEREAVPRKEKDKSIASSAQDRAKTHPLCSTLSPTS